LELKTIVNETDEKDKSGAQKHPAQAPGIVRHGGAL
jgi:hypothetical protein